MRRKIIAISLLTVMLLSFSACLKKKEDAVSSVPDTSSVVSSEPAEPIKTDTPDEPDTIDTPDTPDSPETPDFSQKKEYISPFEFPYEPTDIEDELEEYAEEKGLRFNGTLTMRDAKSVTKVETRSAVNGRILETWCQNEIDDIITLAKNNGLSAYDTEFNVVVYESSRYRGEYDITFYSK